MFVETLVLFNRCVDFFDHFVFELDVVRFETTLSFLMYPSPEINR